MGVFFKSGLGGMQFGGIILHSVVALCQLAIYLSAKRGSGELFGPLFQEDYYLFVGQPQLFIYTAAADVIPLVIQFIEH